MNNTQFTHKDLLAVFCEGNFIIVTEDVVLGLGN